MAAGTDRTTTEGGRRPRKLCATCARNTASSYYWWLEETSVRFVCRECRDSRAGAARAAPVSLGVESLLPLDEDGL